MLRISPSILHKGAEQIVNILGSSASLSWGEIFIFKFWCFADRASQYNLSN